MVLDPATAAMVGAMLGFSIKPDGRIEPIDYSKLAAALDGSDIAFAKKVAIDTSVARGDPPKKFTQAGMQIFVKNPAGTTLPVYIRFNRPDGEEFELTALRRIRGPFGCFYIRNEAGVGTLNLIVTKGFQFEFFEATSGMEVVMDLNSLTDVYVPTPTDQYLLYWKDADSRYELQAITGFQASIDHGSIAGLSGDDHSQYFNVTRHTKVVHDALGLDHGSLSGLADDDHTQYLNVARHDLDDHSGGILSPFPSATSIGGKTLPTGVIVGTTDTQTLSGKTLTTPIIASLYQVALGNLISFPVASIADTVCLLAEGQTLENKTLTTPTIADLSNMTHAHTSAATGGDYPWADFIAADVTYLQALVADITQTNLVDKSATEAISGAWTLTTPTIADLTNMTHSHQNAAGGAQLDHGAALTGLLDDDHTQYQKESEKGAASGYASLDASSKVVEDPATAYLPLAGGEMAGNITFAGAQTVDGVDISAHDVATTGIHGVGSDYLAIAAGSQYTAVNRAGDSGLGQIFSRAVDNGVLQILGGSGAAKGAYLQIHGQDFTAGARGGKIFLELGGDKQAGAFGELVVQSQTSGGYTDIFVIDASGNITTVGTIAGFPSYAAGTYTGNGADDRQITTGFACKLVLLYCTNFGWNCLSTAQAIKLEIGQAVAISTDLLLHATDGFVVDDTDANVSARGYTYVAFG